MALDISTGDGEVLAGVPRLAPVTVATEGWPTNLARASAVLGPRGVTVVAGRDELLPFRDSVFDLVVCRHPVRTRWRKIARVLGPGGTYLSQEVGPASVLRTEFFDIGAVVYFLRKVVWMVLGFTVAEYRGTLRRLHDLIVADGPFVAHTTRVLVEARKPATSDSSTAPRG